MKSLLSMREINPRREAEHNLRLTPTPLNAPDETRAALASGFAALAIHDTLLEIRDLLKANNWEAQQHNQLLVKLLQANSQTSER